VVKYCSIKEMISNAFKLSAFGASNIVSIEEFRAKADWIYSFDLLLFALVYFIFLLFFFICSSLV